MQMESDEHGVIRPSITIVGNEESLGGPMNEIDRLRGRSQFTGFLRALFLGAASATLICLYIYHWFLQGDCQ